MAMRARRPIPSIAMAARCSQAASKLNERHRRFRQALMQVARPVGGSLRHYGTTATASLPPRPPTRVAGTPPCSPPSPLPPTPSAPLLGSSPLLWHLSATAMAARSPLHVASKVADHDPPPVGAACQPTSSYSCGCGGRIGCSSGELQQARVSVEISPTRHSSGSCNS